ncbi:family 16 glycoside hydrolase [Pedobacter frigiditerrae]|uniref:family 16 glycoside hydrolase n=1 Tax=Pedobacter frigiditerrae TaxID=2530452 RepID=UPI00197F03E2|nr:family 16 glycoside hydrolase [Pedobacter frigiditerrae]
MKFLKLVCYAGLTLMMSIFSAKSQDNTLTNAEIKQGWKILFDGKTTNGWKGAFKSGFPTTGWEIMDGCMIVQPADGAESTNGGDIVTTETYGDFELSIDFKLTEGANSGIKYFVDPNQPAPKNLRSALGLEFQLLDDERHPDAKLGKDGNRKLGSLYDLIPAPVDKPVKPVGQWNTARVIARGNHVEHWLNGTKLIEYERGGTYFKQLVAGSKYKDIAGFGLINRGNILLQDHGNKVFYKNIKIKELTSTTGAVTNYGVVSYTFRKSFEKDVAATLDYIKTLGINTIEFSNLFGKTAAELRKLLDDRGMSCPSFGVTYSDLVTKTNEVANNARTLGASFVRVAWVPHDNKVGFTINDAKKTVEDFNAAGKILKEQFGLTFCYHNHGYEFAKYGDGTYYDYLMANTDPDYVSFELDVLWAFHPGADPAALIKKYGSRYRLMHVKDLKKGVKGDLSGVTPVNNDVTLGTGQINLSKVMKAAKSSAIKYYFIEDESDHTATQVPISLAYLEKLLKK